METKINVAAILKDKPQGIRLYSPIFGECEFCYVREDIGDICVKKHNGEKAFFDSKGLYNTLGEVMLFPSREIRNWRKFTWKKGDVLVKNYSDTKVIFSEWYDDSYTSFKAKHYLDSEDETEIVYHGESSLCSTERYSLEDKDAAQTYISAIEKILGGKLNRETLEIEPAQPEFKDGDIVVMDAVSSMCYSKCILILKEDLNTGENSANSYVFYNINNDYIKFNVLTTIRDRNIHLVTEEEKQQLFNALAKEGKAWDSEKKQIINLKPKWTPKPFDRVITRNAADDVWTANIFSHMDSHGEYVTIACVGGYTYCLPYNEETAKLIGTTKDMEDYV